MTTINISIDSDNVINALNVYIIKLSGRLDEFCQRLAEVGYKVADAGFLNAIYDGTNDVTVTINSNGANSRAIVAVGTATMFIEFGTGNEVSPHFDTSIPVAWGTWSAEHAQMLWNFGYWWYEGIKYEGTPAYMPMYYASRAIRENAKRVAQEVFSK